VASPPGSSSLFFDFFGSEEHGNFPQNIRNYLPEDKAQQPTKIKSSAKPLTE
jgi:hypothetical protein